MNYKKLMSHNPYKFLPELTNSLGQKINFYEDPIRGDGAPIICVCHDLGLAKSSGFYELDDMMADHGEYAPHFVDGELKCGFELSPAV